MTLNQRQYTQGYTDYLESKEPQSNDQDYLAGYYDQAHNTEVLGI